MKLNASLLVGAVALQTAWAFSPIIQHSTPSSTLLRAATLADATEAVNPDMTGILDEEALAVAERMVRTQVPISTDIHPSGTVGMSYAYWPAEGGKKAPSVVLIHGFDSNCFEYRRMGPKLAALGINTYAVDVLGWGFSQLDGGNFSADAKIATMQSFVENVVGTPYILGGASLGGAATIEVAARAPADECVGVVLIDAQGFVDGIGPMTFLPKPVAKLGVGVLKSVPLRSSATRMSYFDQESYGTDENMRIGRLHCLREGWDDALVSFMQSGGFAPSKKVSQIDVPALVLWGRQDQILDGTEFAPKFLEELPNGRLEWIEECGHVPHIEQPEQAAALIAAFAAEVTPAKGGAGGAGAAPSSLPIGLAVAGAALAGTAAVTLSQL